MILFSGSQGRVVKLCARYELGSHILENSHGLVVVNTPFDFDMCTLRILNPETTEYIDLPPHFGRKNSSKNTCLTYGAASMEYKVVQVYIKLAKGVKKLTFDAIMRGDLLYECDILTVGAYGDDSWRHMRTDHLSREAKSLLSMGPPLSTEGFVHWVPYHRGSNVLTLDAETEVLTESRVPVSFGHLGKNKFLVSGGKNLTFLLRY
ncbi:Unknown protein [Striga hermonthica]|uniref:F-box associated beta-propeller type 3 domain-containing protein n=1 Tax=Striga hermonthica TaxID=68872 RepID=A0A9N7N0I0_STRHE|nr:Unknown protein [Striga hermonthica]